MKRLKKFKLLVFLTIICSMFTSILTAKAAASATVEFSSNSTVSVGEQITVTMYITNVNSAVGGVVSAGGNLSFDSSYLQYVSATGVTSPYSFQINPSANYKLAGLDTSLSAGITSKTKVFTFVFKALKEGSTTVTLTNATLTDTTQKLSTSVTPKTITVTAAVPKSGDATLKALSVSGYNLSPSFSASTTSYSINVPSTAKSVSISATANHSKAKVTGAGTVNLTSDKTTATIKVTAENGTTKNYTITINRDAATPSDPTPSDPTPKKDNDATLSSLSVSGYTLSPIFKSNVTTYSMKVKNNVTGLNVSAIPNSDKATVAVTGNSGWKVGVNVITIRVTAEDGTVNTYIVNVNREAKNTTSTTQKVEQKSNDNYLKSLTISSSHDMDKKFDKNISSYNITVPYDVEKLDLSYVTNSEKATAVVRGNERFVVEKVNIVEIEVTAEDGTKRYYTLNITRSTKSSDNDLKELSVKGEQISPNFESNILDYTVKVSGNVGSLDITAVPKSKDATVQIKGNENLKSGKNTVLVKVTDKNGFSKYYTIEVQKANTILGLTPIQFAIISIIIGLLIALLIILLLRRKKDKEKEEYRQIEENNKPVTPIIEVKPEFNFGSKNSSDDDVVHGNFNQNSELLDQYAEPKHKALDASYEEVPYDPYDEIVTKDELIDAIDEATKTKDASKLKMLLDQEALNRKKEELKKKEEEEEIDDWRKYYE